MAALHNVKWELFATFLSEGQGVAESYKKAGFTGSKATISVGASNLKSKPEIQSRVAELVEERTRFKQNFTVPIDPKTGDVMVVSSSLLDRAWVLQKLMENAVASADAMQFAASNQALALLGKELGMFGSKPPEDDKSKLGESQSTSPAQITQFLDALKIDTTKLGMENDHVERGCI
jgi:hypothetical protein